MNNLVKKPEMLFDFYNEISDIKLSKEEFNLIFQKIILILSYISLDEIEIIDLIDTLLEFRKNNQLEKINKETISLLKRITNNDQYNLEGTLYISTMLKHLLFPYELNKCDEGKGLFHISKFEILLEMINIRFKENDFKLLKEYNCELSNLAFKYREAMQIYNKKIHGEFVLNMIISHLFSLYYFNQDKYDSNVEKLGTIIDNSIDNYQDFINYCYDEEIDSNFTKVYLEPEELEKEYVVCKKMLDYVYNKEEKRKCK